MSVTNVSKLQQIQARLDLVKEGLTSQEYLDLSNMLHDFFDREGVMQARPRYDHFEMRLLIPTVRTFSCSKGCPPAYEISMKEFIVYPVLKVGSDEHKQAMLFKRSFTSRDDDSIRAVAFNEIQFESMYSDFIDYIHYSYITEISYPVGGVNLLTADFVIASFD
jgi:hypothetical protein